MANKSDWAQGNGPKEANKTIRESPNVFFNRWRRLAGGLVLANCSPHPPSSESGEVTIWLYLAKAQQGPIVPASVSRDPVQLCSVHYILSIFSFYLPDSRSVQSHASSSSRQTLIISLDFDAVSIQ